MAIHHMTVKRAQMLGMTLSEEGDLVKAHWPTYNQVVFGKDANEAIQYMEAVKRIKNFVNDRIAVTPYPNELTLVDVTLGERMLAISPCTPIDALAELEKDEPEWQSPGGFDEPAPAPAQPEQEDVERINGVPVDGAIAYKEGITAADCPYTSETEDDEEYQRFIKWNEEWDAAADQAEAEKPETSGSVVKSTYRARYAEQGHPTHCGDWLAETLNGYCLTPKGIDIERFEYICTMNGVDLSKYNRETPGWQGRLRMTGRNMLAKAVYLAGGVLKVASWDKDDAGQYLTSTETAPTEWMQAQRFKMPKADQTKPIPQPATEAAE